VIKKKQNRVLLETGMTMSRRFEGNSTSAKDRSGGCSAKEGNGRKQLEAVVKRNIEMRLAGANNQTKNTAFDLTH
jgi:hypothetical protein